VVEARPGSGDLELLELLPPCPAGPFRGRDSGGALERGSKLAAAVHFFVGDTTKIFVLLVAIVFVMGLFRTMLSPEKVRGYIEGTSRGIGYVLAVILGAVTPFCSCSSVPLFIGFLEGGIPVGVTMAFLITSPLVNEVAVVILGSIMGWKMTTVYVVTGMSVSILGGILIDRFHMERWVEDYVWNIRMGTMAQAEVDGSMAGAGSLRLGRGQGHRRAHLAVHHHRCRHRLGPAWLCAAGTVRPICLGRQPVRRTGRGADGAAALFQRHRHHSGRRSADRQGRAHRHRHRLHDERRRHFPAGFIMLRKVLKPQMLIFFGVFPRNFRNVENPMEHPNIVIKNSTEHHPGSFSKSKSPRTATA
jgi:hypothetical protein